MRSDLLSKRLFAAGCLGLPWLWTVHVMYHWKGADDGEQEQNEGLLNPDDRTCKPQRWLGKCYMPINLSKLTYISFSLCQKLADFQDDSSEAGPTADEIKIEAQKWVVRCKIGALLGWMLFIAWIVVAQIFRGNLFPNSLYMFSSDSAEWTGW